MLCRSLWHLIPQVDNTESMMIMKSWSPITSNHNIYSLWIPLALGKKEPCPMARIPHSTKWQVPLQSQELIARHEATSESNHHLNIPTFQRSESKWRSEWVMTWGSDEATGCRWQMLFDFVGAVVCWPRFHCQCHDGRMSQNGLQGLRKDSHPKHCQAGQAPGIPWQNDISPGHFHGRSTGQKHQKTPPRP